jgi:hypothetical protein
MEPYRLRNVGHTEQKLSPNVLMVALHLRIPTLLKHSPLQLLLQQ